MKFLKILIFILFISVSGFIVWDHFQKNFEKKIEINFVNVDEHLVDIANFIPIINRIQIKELLEIISNSTQIKILLITLNDSYGLKASDFSKIILQKWIEVNNLKEQNAAVIAIYRKEAEINFLHTRDLDFVFTKDFSSSIINTIKNGFQTADDYMNISIKEGKIQDERYKDIISEGIKTAISQINAELKKAVLDVSRAEFLLRKDNVVEKDNRFFKRFIDNTALMTLFFSFTAIIIGAVFYYNLKNRCPQCGNTMRSEKNVLSYPRGNSPGVREFIKSCLVCGFSHKEREVFFKKSWFKNQKDGYSQK